MKNDDDTFVWFKLAADDGEEVSFNLLITVSIVAVTA